MNQHKQSEDLHIGRGWLNRAAEMLDSCEDHVSDAEFARAAAAIGNGFVALAHAERAMRSSATLDAAAERVRRAAAEARPHDDEPAWDDMPLLDRAAVLLTTLSTGWEDEPPEGVADAQQWLREYREQHVVGCAVCNPEADRG